MDQTQVGPTEPTDKTKLRPIPEIVSEIFDLIKPRFELDGKKFVLIVFDRDEFIKASSKVVGTYSIDTAASCGRQIVLQVVKDYIRQEENSQTEQEG